MAGLSLLLALSTASPAAVVRAAPYRGHVVARVDVRSLDQLEALLAAGADPLTDHPGPGSAVFRLDPGARAVLDASGLPYEVVVPDVQERVDRERARIELRQAQPQTGWYDEFRDRDAVLTRIDDLVAAHGERAERIVLGSSIEGREIVGLRIAPSRARTALFVTATQHAREWVGTMAAMCIAEALLDQDPRVAELTDDLEVFVIPIANPDGYVFTWAGARMWRKNRRDGFGVDLNRNWGWEWGGDGASADPSSETYGGAAAFSEPETAAMRDFVLAHEAISAAVDLHTFGQYILWPWSFGEDPVDDGAYAALGAELDQAVEAVHDHEYTAMQTSDWYPAAGANHDWLYGERGITAFSMELEPDSEDDGGFAPGPEVIGPSCDEAIALVARLGRDAIDRAPPPDDDTGTGGSDTGSDDGSVGSTGPETSTSGGLGESTGEGGAADAGTTTGPLATSSSSGPGSSSSDDDGGTTTGAHDDEGNAGGCGCTASAGAVPWASFVLLALGRRRRRG